MDSSRPRLRLDQMGRRRARGLARTLALEGWPDTYAALTMKPVVALRARLGGHAPFGFALFPLGERDQRRAGHAVEHVPVAQDDVEVQAGKPGVLAPDALRASALAPIDRVDQPAVGALRDHEHLAR